MNELDRSGGLKVLFLFPGPRWDVVHEFASRLEAFQTRIQPVFFTSADKDYDESIGRGRLIAFDYRANTGLRKKLVYYLRYSIRAIQCFARFSRESGKFDLIVSYDPLATGLVGLLLKYRFRTRLICEINGVYEDRALYDDKKFTKLKQGLNSTIQDLVLRRADGIKTLFDGQIKLPPAQKAKVVTFFNHVETDHFYTAEGGNVVLGIGAPFFVKGFDLLVNAFRELQPKHPDWRLVLVGYFDEESEAVEKVVSGIPNVHVMRAVYHRDLPPVMADSSIVVLPSRSEGMGRVLIEAMFARKARVGARVGGIPTVIRDGIDGLLFEKENTVSLVEQLDRLMGDPALRHALAREGERRARRDFSLDRYIERYCSFFETVHAPGGD